MPGACALFALGKVPDNLTKFDAASPWQASRIKVTFEAVTTKSGERDAKHAASR